ncbi:DUF7351 domain-containing protein [Haloglomus litoreum]|uniref:DUF7351 domain-containing protein n=1 Tax=Haloglomus litoreum TaxID=3034026 RepID=UPI0023E80858|nr:hypothetical protein [Haloglomus sp. DT116]
MTGESGVAEMFGLLADETRVDILRAVALAEHERTGRGAGAVRLRFSEIYDRVDAENTSRFSYHLGELTGTYLRKTEEGYEFTHAGERIVRFILSGNYEVLEGFGSEPVDGVCPFCGAEALAASLSERHVHISCGACERPVAGLPVTPAQTRDRDAEAVIRSVRRKSIRDYRQIRNGVCPTCSGWLAADVVDGSDGPLPEADSFLVTSECRECLRQYNAPLTYSVAYHPASVAFHWDRGIDVTTVPAWEFGERLREGQWTSERRSSGPGTYEVTLRAGDDALRFRLDDTAAVTRTERVRRGRGGEPDN